jgi:twitching motility protein PilT
MRIHGDLVEQADLPVLDAATTEGLLLGIAPQRNCEQFAESGDTDFAYQIEGLCRFRCNVFRDRKGPGGVFRVIPSDILTVDDLALSKSLRDLCYLTKGLVVVTGPTGSGKSTTLAALVDLINSTRRDHVITIEDPIEFVHPNKQCLINQREVHVHTAGFKKALRAALREDPDVVLVGEMRDLETIHIALETAETGHLVFGTLHTSSAVSTVDRIIDQFSADQQNQVRIMLSESLKAVIAQVLCKKTGGGRIAALEVLLVNPAVSNLIREGKTFQIPSIMQTNRALGMVTMNEALCELVRQKSIAPEEAYFKAIDKSNLVASFRSRNIPVDFLNVKAETPAHS